MTREQVPPAAEGSVAWALLTIANNAEARSNDETIAVREAHRMRNLAALADLFSALLRRPDGSCVLTGQAMAPDLLAGAAHLADVHTALGEMIPAQKEAADAQALFWRDLIFCLPDVPVRGSQLPIVRVWSTLTANLCAFVFSGQAPASVRPVLSRMLPGFARETAILAQGDPVSEGLEDVPEPREIQTQTQTQIESKDATGANLEPSTRSPLIVLGRA